MGEQIIRWFGDLTKDDVDSVGGRNASLGEMTTTLREAGVRVPDAFAATAQAYRSFLDHNDLESFLEEQGDALEKGERPLAEVGVDMDDVTALLEREGVEELSASWHELLDTVGSGLRARR
jgi:pyruvate,water dikinase